MNIEIKAENGRLDELEEQLLLQRTTRSIQKFDKMPELVLGAGRFTKSQEGCGDCLGDESLIASEKGQRGRGQDGWN